MIFIQTNRFTSQYLTIYMDESLICLEHTIEHIEDLTLVVISYEIYETSLWRDS